MDIALIAIIDDNGSINGSINATISGTDAIKDGINAINGNK